MCCRADGHSTYPSTRWVVKQEQGTTSHSACSPRQPALLDCNAQRLCGLVAAVQTCDAPTETGGRHQRTTPKGCSHDCGDAYTQHVYDSVMTVQPSCTANWSHKTKRTVAIPAGWIVALAIVWTLGVAAVILTQVSRTAWWLRCPVLKPDGCFSATCRRISPLSPHLSSASG